jgi:hypothetical protein
VAAVGQRSNRHDLQQYHENQRHRAVRTDRVIAHDAQHVCTGAASTETVGSIGQTVEMQRARQGRIDGYDQHRSHKRRKDSRKKPKRGY